MTFLAPKDSPTIKTLSLFDWAISALSAGEIPVIGGMTDSILRIRRERGFQLRGSTFFSHLSPSSFFLE